LSSPINIAAIIGFFALFCYIFDILGTFGLKHKYSKEEGKIISPIRYLLISSILLSIFLVMGYLEGYFGFPLSKTIEILFVVIIWGILFGSMYLLDLVYPKKYQDYSELLIFLKRKGVSDDLDVLSLGLFFTIAGMTIFGLMFFDLISIIIIDLLLLFIVGIIGTIKNLPVGLSDIKLKYGDPIFNIFVLSSDNNFISYLAIDNKVKKITIDSVETISDNVMSADFDVKDPMQFVFNYNISQKQDMVIKNDCINLSKITDKFILDACYVSFIIGVLFYIILNAYSLFGFGAFFWGVFGFCLFLTLIILGVLIFKTCKLLTKDLTK